MAPNNRNRCTQQPTDHTPGQQHRYPLNPQSPDTEQTKTNGEEPVTSTETEKTQQQPHLTYRTAQPTDVPELVALVNSCYRGDASRNGWTTEADLLGGHRIDQQSMFALLENPATTILIAEIDNALVACCELQRSVNGTYFGMFSVRPTIQGIGLGRRVLAQAEHTAVQLWGSRLMRMKVIKQRTELIAWYERRGYTNTGKTEPFPYGNPALGEPKRPDLAFVELTKELSPKQPEQQE